MTSTSGSDSLAVALFSEIFMADQLARNRLTKALPKGMEISHFSVLNHLARSGDERSPAQLARAFHVTRGAMTNTLNKLEWAARDAALMAITPILTQVVESIGQDKVKNALPVLREMRIRLEDNG